MFDMLDCKAMATPMDTNLKLLSDETSELVDTTYTRPDICFAVNTLSQYVVKPRRVHFIAAKHVTR